MKNTPFEMCLLFDFYGGTLTPKQQELFDLYYNEDLSLAEIAEHVGITRQGVRDSIVRTEHILRNMEQDLGLVARYGKIELQLKEMADCITKLQVYNQKHLHNANIDRWIAYMQSCFANLLHESNGKEGPDGI